MKHNISHLGLEKSQKSNESGGKKKGTVHRMVKDEGQKDPYQPKKVLNPYLIFVKENRARVGLENPGKPQKEVMTIMSDIWKKMAAEEKDTYNKKSEDDKVRYDTQSKELKERKAQGLPPPISLNKEKNKSVNNAPTNVVNGLQQTLKPIMIKTAPSNGLLFSN